MAVDRHWNLVAANSSMLGLAQGFEVDPALIEPPINVIRLGLHPRGLGPLFVNLGDWHAHWLKRLERRAGGDRGRAARLPDRRGGRLPGAQPRRDLQPEVSAGEMLGPVRMRTREGGKLSFFGMFAGFDTPFEVTTSELAVELLFPADRTTTEALHAQARDHTRASSSEALKRGAAK